MIGLCPRRGSPNPFLNLKAASLQASPEGQACAIVWDEVQSWKLELVFDK